MVSYAREPRPKRACTERIVFRDSSFDSDDSDDQPRRKRRHSQREPAPREKNGCLTCRIRRKKCHGRSPDSDDCQDCVRLGIECLGWGEKRPDWLKRSVPEKVKQIKDDLLARNMIKGHRKSSPPPSSASDRTDDDVPTRAERRSGRPADDTDSSSPDSTLYDDLPPVEQTRQTLDDFLLSSPLFPMPDGEIGAYSYGHDTVAISAPQHAQLHSYEARGYQSTHLYDHAPYGQSLSEAHETTSLRQHYDMSSETAGYLSSPALSDLSWPPANNPVDPFPLSDHYPTVMQWLQYYETEVLPWQYPLRDRTKLKAETQHIIERFGTDGIILLAMSFRFRCNITNYPRNLITFRNEFVHKATARLMQKRLTSTWDKALTGLQLVFHSFSNGTQCDPWVEPLDHALSLCKKELRGVDEEGLRTLLADPVKNMILRTTIWFDIFGAVSLGREPVLFYWYRSLFAQLPEDVLKMDELMGCSTQVMLLWAEIAALEAWKDDNIQQLDTFELCARAGNIDRYLCTLRSLPGQAIPKHKSVQARSIISSTGKSPNDSKVLHQSRRSSTETGVDDPEIRRLIREAFRASARIHLHCVASGFKARVPAIQEAVEETVSILRSIPNTDILVRSITLPLFLAGVMAVERDHMAFFFDRVFQLANPDLGLTLYIRYLVQEVGKVREATNGAEVRWGVVMRECEYRLQLLLI